MSRPQDNLNANPKPKPKPNPRVPSTSVAIRRRSRLQEADVRKAFALRHLGLKQCEIAERLGVSGACVSKMLNRKTWSHVILSQ